MKKYLFLVLLLIFCYFAGRVVMVWDKPNSDSSSRVTFTVPKGASLNKIIGILDEKELIRDPLVFKWFIRYNGLSTKLQAGDYVVQKDLTFAELAEILQNGKSEEVRITIPEGYTIEQIDALLAKKSLTSPGEFKDCTSTCDLGFQVEALEGYLFPSTYFEPYQSFTVRKFIQRLYRTFQQQITALRMDISASERTLDEVVKVASMIEREAFGDSYEEKQMIADVIWKRLDEGIHLGIDATTRYEKNDWTGPLYAEDFAKDTPYNTRRKLGLPPTAISNPGLDSLKAAVYPKSTEYYYYLHDSSGKVHFGKNLEEHNENKRKYIY